MKLNFIFIFLVLLFTSCTDKYDFEISCTSYTNDLHYLHFVISAQLETPKPKNHNLKNSNELMQTGRATDYVLMHFKKYINGISLNEAIKYISSTNIEEIERELNSNDYFRENNISINSIRIVTTE